jgi:hypothetical protein
VALIDWLGLDTVDEGPLPETWRFKPEAAAYTRRVLHEAPCAPVAVATLRSALDRAEQVMALYREANTRRGDAAGRRREIYGQLEPVMDFGAVAWRDGDSTTTPHPVPERRDRRRVGLLVAPYLTLMDESAPQRRHELREVFNGLRYIVRTGMQWRFMPKA